MEEPSITSYALATMCRLCMSRGDVTMFSVFSFMPRFKNRIADVIMKCASVQILKCDEMPKFVCRLCYSQLEKSYQFQMQAIESDKTIRHYLEQLNTFEKKSKLECSNQSPSEDPFIDNINSNIAGTCESLELDSVFEPNVNCTEQEYGHVNSASKISDEMSIKSEIKDELINDYSIIAADCADDSAETLSKEAELIRKIDDSKLAEDANWKLEGSTDCLPAFNTNMEVPLKYEQIDESSLFLTESVVDTINCSSSNGGNVTSCEDTQIGIGHILANTAFIHSTDADVDEYFERCEDKDTSIKPKHTGEKPYRCDVCNKCFTTLGNLKTHKRLHTGEKPYHCDICSISFIESSHLKAHERIHAGDKPYRCDVCNKGFIQLSKLTIHNRKHTGERPYQCDVCNKCFIDVGTLNAHKRIHTGEKRFHCDVCNKGFIQLSNLKVHKRLHTGEKPYRCDVCNKYFSWASKLKIHQSVHTGQRPYHCDVCNKSFIELRHLKGHKRIHTGEKPYQCDVCNKNFNRLSNLKVHKRIHTGEKPFQCDICDKFFNQANKLKLHKRVHTGERPYQCDVCNKCFIETAHLKVHKRIHTVKISS